MPEEIVYAALDYLVGAYLTAGELTVLAYAVVIAAAYAYGSYQASAAKQAQKDAANANLEDRLIMTATTTAPRSRLYGLVRNVDGILFKATHGDKSQFYTFVVAVAGHEITGFQSYYFADNPLTLNSNGDVISAPYCIFPKNTASVSATGPTIALPITAPDTLVPGSLWVTTTTSGSPGISKETVSSGVPSSAYTLDPTTLVLTFTDPAFQPTADQPFDVAYQYGTATPKARVRGYLGTPTQDLSADLIALGIPGVDSTFKFTGIACMLVTLTFDADAFASGVPSMTAVVRGAKCFDPRDLQMKYTRNPALIAMDWATYVHGGGAAREEVVQDMIIASANACDAVINFHHAEGDFPAPTYLCDIVCATKSDPTTILQDIVQSMAGKYAWAGGMLRIKAGYYSMPVGAPLDETWLSGTDAIQMTNGVARMDLVNIIRPTIADVAAGYVMTVTPDIRADTYIALDGQELPRDVTYNAITDADHAQHVSGVIMRDARHGQVLKVPCNMRAYPVELFDVIPVSLSALGLVEQPFEVLNWEFSQSGGVILTMKETAASTYDPDVVFLASDAASNSNLPSPWYVPIPAGISVTSGTSALDDGSVITRVAVAWLPTTSESVRQAGKYEVQWTPAFQAIPSGDWPNQFAEGSATGLVVVGAMHAKVAYLIRVREVNAIGIRGAWGLHQLHIVADVPAVDAAAALAAAAAAQASANAALAELANIASDNVLSAGEKPAAILDWNTISAERAGIVARASAMGIGGTFLSGYTVAIDNLAAYLNSLSPGWADTSTDTPIVGATFRAKFGDVYAARQVLLNEISRVASLNGIYSQETAPTSPKDGDIWQVPSTGVQYRWDAASSTWVVFGTIGSLDIFLIGTGGVVVAGNTAKKTSGVNDWTGQAYGRDSFRGGCYATAQITISAPSTNVMIGLNSKADLTDASYNTIDYAIYAPTGTYYRAYQSGYEMQVFTDFAQPAAGDVVAVTYDGYKIRWYINGVKAREVDSPGDLVFYFDSALYEVGSGFTNARFGPLSDISPALAAAAAAQAAASAANAELANIASDNVLTSGEKSAVILDWNSLATEQAGIDARAAAVAITTERFTYDTAMSTLAAYLTSLVPGWSTLGVDTPIDGPTFRAKFADVYAARQAVLNEIARRASLTATWGQIDGISVTTGQVAASAATETYVFFDADGIVIDPAA